MQTVIITNSPTAMTKSLPSGHTVFHCFVLPCWGGEFRTVSGGHVRARRGIVDQKETYCICFLWEYLYVDGTRTKRSMFISWQSDSYWLHTTYSILIGLFVALLCVCVCVCRPRSKSWSIRDKKSFRDKKLKLPRTCCQIINRSGRTILTSKDHLGSCRNRSLYAFACNTTARTGEIM